MKVFLHMVKMVNNDPFLIDLNELPLTENLSLNESFIFELEPMYEGDYLPFRNNLVFNHFAIYSMRENKLLLFMMKMFLSIITVDYRLYFCLLYITFFCKWLWHSHFLFVCTSISTIRVLINMVGLAV